MTSLSREGIGRGFKVKVSLFMKHMVVPVCCIYVFSDIKTIDFSLFVLGKLALYETGKMRKREKAGFHDS